MVPTASVDFVAYFARYDATAMLGTWPSAVAGSAMVRVSSWAPHRMSHPWGRAGWATVANHVEAAAVVMASASCAASRAGGIRSPSWVVASRRKMAWKWTRPRAWNSATLAYDSCTFPAPAILAALASWRRMAMVVRRHSSGAWAFQTTAPL